MDETGNFPLVQAQDFARLVVLQVFLEVRHDLAGEVVKKLGVAVISDIVEVDEAADNVVFQSAFLDAVGTQPKVAAARTTAKVAGAVIRAGCKRSAESNAEVPSR